MERPQLTQEIIAAIGANADNRITGTVLRNILLKIVDGTQLNIVGMAYTDTEPDEVFEDVIFSPVYIAAGTGTYTHFNGIVLVNELALLRLTEEGWVKDTVVILDEIEFPAVELLKEAAETAATKAEAYATAPEDTEVEEGKYSALHHAAKAESAAATAANEAIISAEIQLASFVNNAETHELKAEKWADEAEDVPVETGKYSAKHWAAKAEDEKEAAEDVVNTQIPSLLSNFFDPAIIALNSRIVSESATVVEKLRFIQEKLDILQANGIEPTLAMFPCATKANKLYSVLPVDGSGDFNVLRDSVGVRINAESFETIAANVPIVDNIDNKNTLYCSVQMTNRISHFIDFSNIYWNKTNTVVDDNLGNRYPDPVGGNNAFKLNETSIDGYHSINKSSINARYRLVIAKKGERHLLYVSSHSSSSVLTTRGALFNLELGTIQFQGSSVSATILPLKDGWYLCMIDGYTNASTIHTIGIGNDAGSAFYLGEANKGLYIYNTSGTEVYNNRPVSINASLNGTLVTKLADIISVNLPDGITEVTLTDSKDIDVVDASPSDPYIIPKGSWSKIIME